MIKKTALILTVIAGALSLSACNDNSSSNTDSIYSKHPLVSDKDQFPLINAEKISKYKEGVQYRVLKNPLEYVNNQVTEFFWYGCPHCYAAEPSVSKWVSESNGAYTIKKEHSQLSERWIFDANVFYGLQQVKRMDISKDYFEGRQNGRFKDIEDVKSWLIFNYVNPEQFFNNLNKPDVVKMRELLLSKERGIGAGGVPTFVVEGKYLVLVSGVSSIGGWEGLPGLLSYLSDLDGK